MQSDAPSIARCWAELWSIGDSTLADRVFAADLRDHRSAPFEDVQGIEAELRFIALIRSAFPDLRVEIADLLVDGDRVAARVIHHGTHRGELLDIPPTGRRVTYEGMVIFRMADGRIAERWGTVDLFGILRQLGAEIRPAAGSARSG